MPRTAPPTPASPHLAFAYQAAILIKSLRTFFRLSQGDLAKLSRVSRPTIDRIESLRGIERARPETLEQLLDVFRYLGVALSIDPEQGVQVHFTLTAMALSVEKLTDDPELRERLQLFARPGDDRPSPFDHLLALAATQRTPLMERYRERPFPKEDDPVWQQAQQAAHDYQADALASRRGIGEPPRQ